MHDKKAVSFPQNAWGHELEIAPVCEGGSSEHIHIVISIGKIPISNSFHAILQNISLWHMSGLCIYMQTHILINCDLKNWYKAG